MLYSIGIMVAAVALLVFFSRPSTSGGKSATAVSLHADDTHPIKTTKGPDPELLTLTAEHSYQTPTHQTHTLDVTVNLKNRTITTLSVLYNNHEPTTPQHKAFDAAIHEAVVGKPLTAVSLSRVGGASLTTAAFNAALADIKKQLA